VSGKVTSATSDLWYASEVIMEPECRSELRPESVILPEQDPVSGFQMKTGPEAGVKYLLCTGAGLLLLLNLNFV